MKPIRSITEQVYVVLRADLINCRIRPGAKLRTNELSKRFAVSLSSVREALARLSADGLAVADPQRGFTAAPISAADLSALTEAHIGIESLCIERSLMVGDAAWEKRLQQAFLALAAVPLTQDGSHHLSVAFSAAHSDFEIALIAACDNPWLLRLRSALSVQAERYKRICLPVAAAEPDPMQMARSILRAALARYVASTVALVAESFRMNAARFVQALQDSSEEIQFSDAAQPNSSTRVGLV
jgi:DNA-binding GntR family transcriptional regulator